MSFTYGWYLRHRTRSNKVKARCTLFHVITYAIHVEQTLIHVTRISLAVQYETSQSIDSTCTTMHGWFNYVIHGAQFVALLGDHNEVFESLYIVLQSLLLISTVNFRISNRLFFFLFQYLTFTVWLLCIQKLFHFGEGRCAPYRHFNIMAFSLNI